MSNEKISAAVETPAVENLAADSSSAESITKRPSFILRFLRKPFGLITLLYLALLALASFVPTILTSADPLAADMRSVLSTPSAEHILGTDALGRDMFARMVHGTASSMGGVLIAIVVTLVIAIPLGLVSAMNKRVDRVMSGVNDIVLSIPAIMVMLMVLAVTGDLRWAMVGLGFLNAPGLIRVVRSSAMVIVEEPYVAAAKVFGQGDVRIAIRHVLPRIMGPIVVTVSLVAGGALGTQAGLNFMGLGINPPNPSWGGLVADGAKVINQQPWTFVPGGVILALTIIMFVLFGDTVRDVTVESWAVRPTAKRKRKAAKAELAIANVRHEIETPIDPEAMLQIDDLRVTFPDGQGGEIHIVDGVSLVLPRGGAVGLVGESGCGKTMTGLAVAGALPATARITSGRILVDGVNVLELSRKDRQDLRGKVIAFVSQEPMVALDPLFTVGYQIGEAIRTHTGVKSRPEVDKRVLELLSKVQINDPERTRKLYPHEISGGMAQRVAIAVALAGDPKILIADEPTTALDVTVQAEIIALLKDLQEDAGLSVLLISHDWGVVSELCEDSAVMYAGQVVERGSVDSILSSPVHPYTYALLAANPHLAEPGGKLNAIPGSVPPPEKWPTSCRFASRCLLATETCSREPIPMTVVDEQMSRCIRVDALREMETAQ